VSKYIQKNFIVSTFLTRYNLWARICDKTFPEGQTTLELPERFT